MKKIIILLIGILLLTGCELADECSRERCEKNGGTFVESYRDCYCIYNRMENEYDE